MSENELDPAAIMAAHENHVRGCKPWFLAEVPHKHCEPYRLAEALIVHNRLYSAALEASQEREADAWDAGYKSAIRSMTGGVSTNPHRAFLGGGGVADQGPSRGEVLPCTVCDKKGSHEHPADPDRKLYWS